MAFLHSHTKFGITFDQAYFRLHESEYRWKNEPEANQAGVAEKYTTVRGSFFVYKDQSTAEANGEFLDYISQDVPHSGSIPENMPTLVYDLFTTGEDAPFSGATKV
jgi:hypothetical protein